MTSEYRASGIVVDRNDSVRRFNLVVVAKDENDADSKVRKLLRLKHGGLVRDMSIVKM